MNYGIPYKGSKNKIIKWLMQKLPRGEVFVDLFCGGCAVTHAAILSDRYKRYAINDINPMMPRTFTKAMQGVYKDEDRWISRDDFFRLKGKDEYATICFSFGNNMRSYMYSQTIEPYKKACHYAILFNEWVQLSERVSAMSKSNLDEFGNSCLQHDQQLLADYKKLLDAYSWKNIFYLYNGKSV